MRHHSRRATVRLLSFDRFTPLGSFVMFHRVIKEPTSTGVRLVIIECPSCGTSYKYDVARFEGKPSKKIRCAKCKKVFAVQNPEFEQLTTAQAPTPAAPTPSAPAPSKQSGQDETRVGKPPRRDDAPTTEETGTYQITADPSMPENLRFSLAITEGPGSAQVFRIEKPSVTVGRLGADVTLPDPEASRNHAQLQIRDGHYFLSDMGSRNGTWIDGQQIEGETEISNQTEFRVGATTLMLIVTSVD